MNVKGNVCLLEMYCICIFAKQFSVLFLQCLSSHETFNEFFNKRKLQYCYGVRETARPATAPASGMEKDKVGKSLGNQEYFRGNILDL